LTTGRDALCISSTKGQGIPTLLERIDDVLPPAVRATR
jgi:hypothetical protein